ncbi:hypothetical protein E0H36_08475 [Rhizobium leguminosarum bv. viciae]|uniref:hypothetical protein n=1 Tax=Rhizobium leguminosarum TaxID=384 RepID=UPI00103B9F4C|nr:hypothetical protein [Rhizobium leguminosarum]MBY5484415.1 hypothetical protein [Rhizobium leguminosarum]TBZ34474.1 hypothetical protein E0H36_08475 [Rhizobium leguminosarum bv. viciae]
MMMRDALTMRAYHEAGHAVANWLSNIEVEFISVGGDSKGARVESAGLAIDQPIAKPLGQRLLIVAWAGWAADLAHLKSLDPHASPYDVKGWGNDQKKVHAILLAMGLKTRSEGFYQEEARQLLQKPDVWAKVVAVAEMLISDDSLSRFEFGGLMQGLGRLSSTYWSDLKKRHDSWWAENFA